MRTELRLPRPLWRGWLGYASAAGAVLLVTALISLLVPRLDILPRSLPMLFLLTVVAIGSTFGSGPAALSAVLSWLSFDLVFVGPPKSFLLTSDRDEAVIDLLLLVTALVTGELASELRRRVRQVAQREREASLLYDVVRLISEPEPSPAVRAVADRLREALRFTAVRFELDENRAIETAGEWPDGAEHELPFWVLSAGTSGLEHKERWVPVFPERKLQHSEAAVYVAPVRGHDKTVGRLLLIREAGAPELRDADNRLLAAVAVQIGQSVERVRLQREATEGEILRRTNELKTALLNTVSHDLRTPLSSILASAGSLLQDDVQWTDDDRREFAEGIRDEAARLNRIVENLLDLSRIEGGSLQPHKSWYDLRTLVDDVLERLRPLTSRHTVRVEIADCLPPVFVDYVELDQVLSNLVENAAKYAPAGTEILIAARQADGEPQVEVADRGPGIPEEAAQRLFEPFFQLRTRVEQANRAPVRLKGSGLGLAVAHGLVQAHGGRIWVENRADGGARFVFTLGSARPNEVVLERQGKV